MKILWLSEAGFSCDLAFRSVADGHEVKVWIKEEKWRQVYDGIIDKVPSWQKWVSWCDFIVFDHTGMSDIWKQVKSMKPCFGGSDWADKLEKDRLFAKQIFKQIGLQDFEHLRVKTWDESEKHVLEHKVKHVVKPCGKEVDSHHVIISEDNNGADAAALCRVFKEQGVAVDYIEIEERKEGVEVGLSGWFAQDWCGPININFEHKRFATGIPEGIGPLTGEMGTAMFYTSQSNPLFRNTLDKIKPLLIENDYRGQIDLSFILNDKGAWPLEATPRLGYPACMIEDALQITPWAELMYSIACGDYIENRVLPDWAIGVVVVMPGYPSTDEVSKRSVDIPIFGWNVDNANQIHLVEVKAGKSLESKTDLVTSEGQGYPLVVTGTGKTIEQAKKAAYRWLDQSNGDRVRIPGSFWRTDIGDRVIRQRPQFQVLRIEDAHAYSDIHDIIV